MEQLKVMQTQGMLCTSDPPVPPPAHNFPVTTITSEVSLHLSLQLTMRKRYDVSQKALDLHKLRFDPGIANISNSREGEGTNVFLRGRPRNGNEGGAGPGPLSTF